MVTRILDAENGLDEAVSLLKAGELVAFPTETVYGLGADAFNGDAVKKIFEAKGRPQDNPLIVHIASVEQAAEVARDIPDEFYILAREFMPGPLTVVLPKSDAVPGVVTAGGDTVAVRMPSHPVARRLIAASMPLAAPSANRSKHISPTTARHVLDDLDGRVPLILDGGECGVGIESTVLDLTSAVPTVLRPGAVTEEMIAEILGRVGSLSPGAVIGRAKSPGMKYTHYAPSVPAVVAMSEEAAFARYDEGGRETRAAHDRAPPRGSGRESVHIPRRGRRGLYAAVLRRHARGGERPRLHNHRGADRRRRGAVGHEQGAQVRGRECHRLTLVR